MDQRGVTKIDVQREKLLLRQVLKNFLSGRVGLLNGRRNVADRARRVRSIDVENLDENAPARRSAVAERCARVALRFVRSDDSDTSSRETNVADSRDERSTDRNRIGTSRERHGE